MQSVIYPVMRNIVATIFLILNIFNATAQIDLTPEEWRQDLQFLQSKVHSDFPFLFKKITSKDFDNKVGELYEAIPELTDNQVVVGLARIVSLFGYGHTGIWLHAWDADNIYGFHQMPYNLYQFSDGIYVQGAHQYYRQTLGAKVLEVESMPVEKAMEAIRPVVPAENDQFFKAHGLDYLGIPEVLHAQGVSTDLKTTVTLTLEKNGKAFKQTFEAVDTAEYPKQYGLITQKGPWLDARDQSRTPLWLKNLERIYFYQYLPEHKAVYIRHSQIQDDPDQSIPDFYRAVFEFMKKNPVERFILDVRLNGGGNNYKNKPIVTGLIKDDNINQAGKLFVILGRRTFSACQNLVNELDNYTEAIFVGEPTAENINFYGDNTLVELPNSKIPAYLSFAWWQDKPQWEDGPWLAPQLAIDLSYDDYKNNRDPVLAAILEYDDSTPLLDPIEYLSRLYQEGKMDQIKPEAQRLVQDPRYRYYPFEIRINQQGYNLMRNGQMEGAIFVFTINSQLFPESANAWDSLAESYWKHGQPEQARTLYQKAIHLDPEGPVGENARTMLERMSETAK